MLKDETFLEIIEECEEKYIPRNRWMIPYDCRSSFKNNTHKTIKLVLYKGLEGGALGYQWIELLEYYPKSRLFDAMTDVGFQKIHKLELLTCLWQYKEA